MRPSLIVLLAAAAALPLPAQTASDIESGLLPAVRIRGHTRPMRLDDRMAYYHVPGVSIAVINGGRVEWARAYGVREVGLMAAVGVMVAVARTPSSASRHHSPPRREAEADSVVPSG